MLIQAKFRSVCKSCGKAIEVGDRISWQRGEKTAAHALCSNEGKAIAAKVEESAAINANVSIPCPVDLEYLDYQRAGIAYALKRQGTLIADEMK